MKFQKLKSVNILIIVAIFIILYTNYWAKIHETTNSVIKKLIIKQRNTENNKTIYNKDDYILKLSKERLNKLFKVLHGKESVYNDILKDFNLISFTNLLNKTEPDEYYNYEINKYLTKNNNEIEATDAFIDHLYKMSHIKIFINNTNPNRNLLKKSMNKFDVKPVIVTAAHSGFYKALEATVERIHKIFPDYELIIYDLGLEPLQLKKVINSCKCQVRKYDPDQKYANKSNHTRILKTYAWKPLIIQEVFNSHQTILYVDSSIYFKTNEMKQTFDTAKTIGFSSQILSHLLNQYTNLKMFEWFKEDPKDYEKISFLEANALIFDRCFITSLMMKSWVTCALDEECIAPKGHRLMNCPGCHRYDQSALTTISSYFYGHPKDNRNFSVPYAFLDRYFYSVRRGHNLPLNQVYFKDIS